MPARGFCLTLVLALGAAFPIQAAEPAASRTRVAQGDPHAECYCRAQGRQFGMGAQLCLRSPDGPRMARCVMDLNVTSWRFTQEPCPDS
jgi:hypothetical protein